MTSSSQNLYHVQGFESRTLLETYFSNKPDTAFVDDALKYPMEKLHKTLMMGHIKGTNLIDFSLGPFIHHLYSVCDFFQNIIVMRFKERCIMELNRWLHDRTGAYDWSHTTDIMRELEGEREEEKELKLKTAIKHVIKCDLERDNLIDPLDLAQADCVISAWLLESISKEKKDYIKNLKKILKFLKPGGHLILVGCLKGTYYTVGEEKFHIFKYDENFAKEAITGEGLTIDSCEVIPRTAESDLTDYMSNVILTAHKEEQI